MEKNLENKESKEKNNDSKPETKSDNPASAKPEFNPENFAFDLNSKKAEDLNTFAATALKILLSQPTHPQSLVCKNFCFEMLALHDLAQLDEHDYLNLKKVIECWVIAKDSVVGLKEQFLTVVEKFSYLFQGAFAVPETPVTLALKKVFPKQEIREFNRVVFGLAGLLTAFQCSEDIKQYKFYQNLEPHHVREVMTSNIALCEKIEKKFKKALSRNKMLARAAAVAFSHNYIALWRQYLLFNMMWCNISVQDTRITDEERMFYYSELSLPQQWYFLALFIHSAIFGNMKGFTELIGERLVADKGKIFETVAHSLGMTEENSVEEDDEILESDIIG